MNQIGHRCRSIHACGVAVYGPVRVELFCLMVAFCIGSAASALVNAALGFALQEEFSGGGAGVWWTLALVAAGGVFLDGLGTVFNRTANLRASDLEVNAMAYITPLLGLF